MATYKETMKRQAEMLRAMLNASTPEDPITLSPNLYDKLPPEQRSRFIRG